MKHDIFGDIMFYFIIKCLVYLMIITFSYYYFNKKQITILEILILLFIFNICLFSLYHNINLIITLLLVILTIIVYYLTKFLESKKEIKEENILINRGIINFQGLLKENITYDNLLLSLKKEGISNPCLVDYCIKKGKDLIILPKNSLGTYPISLIIDGKVLKDNLFSINKSIDWLNKKIKDNNLSLININYAYYKNKNVYFITD